MRLATIATPGGPRAALAGSGHLSVIDAYEDVGALLSDGEAGQAAARDAEAAGVRIALQEATLLRPVLHPGAVVCVGLNYRTHILEMGRELPTSPTLFSKLPRALTDPHADIVLPVASERMDFEGELVIVIGEGGRDVPRDEAWKHVAGLTIMNDVTARDFQRRTVQWFAGKTFQSSTPFGPWIVTPDELGDLEGLMLTVEVNGEPRQSADLGDMVFDVPALVSDLSQIVTLAPGDLIATGTPGGVGEPSERFLGPGDVVEVAIDGIGSIRNTFVGP